MFARAVDQVDRGGGPVSAIGLGPCLRQTIILVRHVDSSSPRHPFCRGVGGGGRPLSCLKLSCQPSYCVVLAVVPRDLC